MVEKKQDKKQLDIYRKLLLKLQEKIVHDIRNMSSVESASAKDTSVDVSSHALHIADVATDMYDREFSLGLASKDREQLLRIEQALKRIDDHNYGNCISCKKPIASARLKAIPYTEYCRKCQEKSEQGSRRST